MVGLGLWATRKARNAVDYRVAGRRLGMTMYVGTMSAVVIGGSATVGGVALGYQYGISAFWMVCAIAIGLLVLSLFIAGPIRKAKVYTINQVVELRYGPGAASKLSSLVTVLYTLTLAVNSTSVYATIFAVIFPDITKAQAVILGGLIVVIYSVFGGMWSITLTDMMQFLFMTAGMFLILLPFSLYHAGGFGRLVENLPATFFSPTGIGYQMIITYLVTFVLGMLIGQDIWQRVFTSRTPQIAKWGGTISAVYVALYAVAGALIGMCGRVILPELGNQNRGELFARLATGYVPPILGGIVLAAGVAAMMSTASGTLIAAATVTRVDIAPLIAAKLNPRRYGKTNRLQGAIDPDSQGGKTSAAPVAGQGPEAQRRQNLKADRIYVLIFGIIVIGLATLLNDPVTGMIIGYDLLVGGLLVPMLGGFIWKRANLVGASWAMIVGIVATVIGLLIYGPDANQPIYVGILGSLVVFVLVSWFTPPTPSDLQQRWKQRIESSRR